MSTTARFSLAEYDRIVESGALDRRRLELIRGEIIEMTPIGPRHEEVVDRLARWSMTSVSEEMARVRVQQSIGLPETESAPEPDLTWVAPKEYSDGRPQSGDVLLVIEVADSSLAYDRGVKAEAYAHAGIADYWIANLSDWTIEVHRDPREGSYRDVTVFRGRDELRPQAFPDVVLRPERLYRMSTS